MHVSLFTKKKKSPDRRVSARRARHARVSDSVDPHTLAPSRMWDEA